MTRAAALRRLCRAALLTLPVLALPAGPALAAGAELTYGVWSDGMRVMDLTVTMENGGADYRVGLEAELVGPPAWFESYRLRTHAEGRVDEGLPAPLAWRTEQRTDKKKVKWIELAFDGAGLPLMTSDPPFSPNIRPALDEAELAGSRDPLSAIFALLQASEAAGGCAGESKVYDGRRRFDLAMLDRGAATVEGNPVYRGPAWRCAVELTPVAGYRFDGEDKTEVSSGTLLYLAEVVPGLPRLPVRIEAGTGYGGVEIHLLGMKPLP